MVTFETDAASVTLEGLPFRTTLRGVTAKDVGAVVELWDGRVVTLGCRFAY